MKTVIVQMADRAWTERALHIACAMARHDEAVIILLQMIPVQHYSWLGTSLGQEPLGRELSNDVWDYRSIARNYGMELCVEPLQWVSYIGAVVDAAEELDADVVFADLPHSAIPGWRKLQTWDLRRQLQARHCALYTLEQPAQAVVVSPLETANHHV